MAVVAHERLLRAGGLGTLRRSALGRLGGGEPGRFFGLGDGVTHGEPVLTAEHVFEFRQELAFFFFDVV